MGFGRNESGCARTTLLKVLVLVLVAATLTVVLVITLTDEHEREGSQYRSAAVSSDGTPCAQIAVNILDRGGTAADGLIATMICSGVVNPHSTGLGGGFLVTYYDINEGKAYTLNARETAPAAATEDMYEGDADLSLKGGLAVAVPGELRGHSALYERFGGGVAWEDLLMPSIELCEQGNPVSHHLANALQSQRDAVLASPSLSQFVDPATGDVLQEGDILYLPDLGATLRVIQNDSDALYTGSLAPKLIEDLTAFGGIITEEDLVNYEAVWSDPIEVDLFDRDGNNITLYSIAPPGSGSVMAFILNVLDEYNLDDTSLDPDNEIVTYQRITEAFKYAFAMRTYLGDAAYVDVTEVVANLTSEEYARSIHDEIMDNATSQDPQYYGAYSSTQTDYGTSHSSVLSATGDAAAGTGTINTSFGAKIASAQTGIIFNNEMDDFSSPNITNYFGVEPSPANYIEPGKRPLSSMCPAVLVNPDGDVRMVTGAAGGTKITTAVALTTAYNLWLGYDLHEAIKATRLHHQLTPMELEYEEGFSQTVVDGLAAIGHVVEQFPEGGSVMSTISREGDVIYAESDWRKSGQVDGY